MLSIIDVAVTIWTSAGTVLVVGDAFVDANFNTFEL